MLKAAEPRLRTLPSLTVPAPGTVLVVLPVNLPYVYHCVLTRASDSKRWVPETSAVVINGFVWSPGQSLWALLGLKQTPQELFGLFSALCFKGRSEAVGWQRWSGWA